MKKIVSVLSVAALTFSVAFAADVSIRYRTRGTVYSEKTDKVNDATTTQIVEFLNQSGYASPKGDLKIKATSDLAGIVIALQPNAADKSIAVDEFYGFMNFANLQITTGKWTSRYVNRVTTDAGKWEGKDYEVYKPGILPGIFQSGIGYSQLGYGKDVDNLTLNLSDKQELSTSLAYTIRPNDNSYFMVKGLLVDGDWGRAYVADKESEDIIFKSGFAGEIAYKSNNLIDFNACFKSLSREKFAAGVFVRPLMLGDKNLMVGFTWAQDLKSLDAKKNGVADYKHTAYEYGIDLRFRMPINESLALTTMNNLSSATIARVDSDAVDRDYSAWKLWDMVSVAYKASEKLTLQLTVESETGWGVGKNYDNNGKKEDCNFAEYGGFTLSVIPGVVYNFNSNASLTAGVRIKQAGVFATNSYKENSTVQSEIAIPFVFNVAL